MNTPGEVDLKRNDYDFSASQDDSPLREYKPLCSFKQRKTDSSVDEVNIDQNKENSQSASNLQNQTVTKVAEDKRNSLEERNSFRRRVAYVHSEELIQRCNQMIKIPMRVI